MSEDTKLVKTILIVDDDKPLLIHVAEMFKDHKSRLKVKIAVDVEQALLNLPPMHPEPPDVVILDIMMPYRSVSGKLDAKSDPIKLDAGIRVLKELRNWEQSKQGGTPAIWVAVITARNDPAVLQEIDGLLQGKGCIYCKPFDPDKLESDLLDVLGV